jgi:AmmeMemoRadiSam system protein B
MHTIRPAAVAGLFYPGERATLAATLDMLLRQAGAPTPGQWPKAIIAPHAGYIYSGPVAAEAYARLRAARDAVKRVVLMGPCHREPVRGIALPAAGAFATPLGEIPIDQAAVAALADLPQVVVSRAAHALEHSLEVQLPFLQTMLDDFALVPLAVGDARPREVAEVLERLWGGAETLIVISSDLSHYHRYEDAREIDARTCRDILDFGAELDHEQACGATPIAGLMHAARSRAMRIELLDARNSGDTAGDRSRVVGYAAFALHETPAAQPHA